MNPPRFEHVVAMDGPSGTGKSTVSRLLAQRLGARYLDTGAMYRAATLAVLRAGVDPDDSNAVTATVRDAVIDISTDPDAPSIALDGDAADEAIRTQAVTAAVSAVSAVPEVRTQLVEAQRALIGAGGIVVEGRDIATVVWPQARVRLYVTASPQVRAQRRAGADADAATVAEIAADIARRDAYDSSRATSPLRQAEGATLVDTTELDIDAVVDRLAQLVAAADG